MKVIGAGAAGVVRLVMNKKTGTVQGLLVLGSRVSDFGARRG